MFFRFPFSLEKVETPLFTRKEFWFLVSSQISALGADILNNKKVRNKGGGGKRKEKNEKKKGVFRSEWLNEFSFLKEYKQDKTRVTCMACNNQFSVHYGGKNDVLQHSKSKQHLMNSDRFYFSMST